MDYGLCFMGYGLWVMSYGLWVMGYGYRFLILDFYWFLILGWIQTKACLFWYASFNKKPRSPLIFKSFRSSFSIFSRGEWSQCVWLSKIYGERGFLLLRKGFLTNRKGFFINLGGVFSIFGSCFLHCFSIVFTFFSYFFFHFFVKKPTLI